MSKDQQKRSQTECPMHVDASPDIEARIYQSGAVMNCLYSGTIFIWGRWKRKYFWFREQSAQAAMW